MERTYLREEKQGQSEAHGGTGEGNTGQRGEQKYLYHTKEITCQEASYPDANLRRIPRPQFYR